MSLSWIVTTDRLKTKYAIRQCIVRNSSSQFSFMQVQL